MAEAWNEQVDVIIIGAGMAGLAAAEELVRAGHSLCVVEARDRVGGRVFTKRDGARILELGAQAVHTNRATTWEVIAREGLATEPIAAGVGARAGRLSWLRSRQRRQTQSMLRKLQRGYAAAGRAEVDFARFLGTLKLTKEERVLAEMIASTRGAEPRELGLAAMMDYGYGASYQNFRVVEGYQTLPEAMASALGERVLLRSPVRSVFWKRGSVRVEVEHEGAARELAARAVIVSVPLGVLKHGEPRFEPELPSWKAHALDALGTGRHLIARMQFKSTFWRSALRYSSKSVPGSRVLINQDLRYDDTLRLDAFAATAGELGQLSEQRRVEQLLSWTSYVFRESERHLRAQLVGAWMWDWDSDPYARGAYSFSPVGAARPRALLGVPVQGTLFFAGEATVAPVHHPTVHGAYETGIRAAREVVGQLQKSETAAEAARPLYGPMESESDRRALSARNA